MLYNIDLALWQSAKEAYQSRTNGGPRLLVVDGMICDGFEVLARFKTQFQAVKTLKDAGFYKVSKNTYKATSL